MKQTNAHMNKSHNSPQKFKRIVGHGPLSLIRNLDIRLFLCRVESGQSIKIWFGDRIPERVFFWKYEAPW